MADRIKIISKIDGKARKFNLIARKGLSLDRKDQALGILMQLEGEKFEKAYQEIIKALIGDEAFERNINNIE